MDILADQIEKHGQQTTWTWKQRLTVLRDAALGMLELYRRSSISCKNLASLHLDTNGVAIRQDGSAFLICSGAPNIWYVDPESGTLEQVDSYAFGVILYEVLL